MGWGKKNPNEPKRNMTLVCITFVGSPKYWGGSVVQWPVNDRLSLWAGATFMGSVRHISEDATHLSMFTSSLELQKATQTKRARAACLKLFQTVSEIRKSPRIPAGRERALWSQGPVRTPRWRHTSSIGTLYVLGLLFLYAGVHHRCLLGEILSFWENYPK